MFLIRTLCALTILAFTTQVRTAAIFNESIYADCALSEAGFENSNSPSAEICTTPGCLTAASSIQKWMNLSADPCHDFYEFACGNFAEVEYSQLGNPIFNNIVMLQEKVLLTLKKNIENDIIKDDPKVFHKIKTFYDTCMDTEQIEKTSKDHVKEILKELGGWPLLEGSSWNETAFDWKKTMYKLNEIGYSMKYFIDISHEFNATNLSVTFYLRPSRAKEGKIYEEFGYDLIEKLEINRTASNDELELMVEFEKVLSMFPVEKQINPLSIKDLQTIFPDLPWTKLLFQSVPLEKLKSYSIIIYFDLKRFFTFMSTIPKRIIANYMMWNVVVESSLIIRPEHASEFQIYDVPRWPTCLHIIKALPLASSALFKKKNLDKDNEKMIASMVGHLKKTLKSWIYNVDWLDNKTKIAALEKLKNLSDSALQPSELTNDVILDEYHRNLNIISNNFLRSYLSILRFRKYSKMDYILKSVHRESLWMLIGSEELNVNAYYYKIFNTVVIPVAVHGGVFFSKDRPQYLNYGALGHVIGHELFHAFEPKNDKIDDLIIWTNESITEFKHRAQCIVNQYRNYSIKEDYPPWMWKSLQKDYDNYKKQMKIPWEDLADIAGVKLSYTAYNSWEKENMMEARLALSPNTNYTSQQMFWISAANTYCTNDEKPNIYLPGSHSSHQYRVNGMLSNMREFSRDFNCSTNSRMYQPKKYPIW